MSFVTTLFFAASSFGCRDLVSLSRLNFVAHPLDSCCNQVFSCDMGFV